VTGRRAVDFAVESTAEEVVVWSTARLPFEATGDLLRLRTTLRAALRNMAAQPGAGLLATYAAPDKAFVDVENVLLYNVGAASYGHLLSAGLVCRRVPGADNRHHMRYETVSPLPEPDPGAIQVLAEVDAPLNVVMRLFLRDAGPQRQDRCGSVQRLHLALLIHLCGHPHRSTYDDTATAEVQGSSAVLR